jgi:ACS family glucarate transporter-like MFS transporter
MGKPDPATLISTRSSSIRWTIASLVGIFAFVSYVLRMNISVAAELMMPDLGLTKTQMGEIFSSFLVGYAIFQVPAGKMGDVIGPRLTLTLAALLWGCATVLTGFAPNVFGAGTLAILLALATVRFLLGAAEAATFPVGSRAIRNWTPPSERAFGNAFMMAGSASAAAISAPLISWLMLHVGWHAAFYLTSILAFAIALVWYLTATDYPAQHNRVSHDEFEKIGTFSSHAADHYSSMLQLLRDRNILFLSLSYTCEGYVLFIFVFWLYIYLVEVRGFSMLNGGLVASLPWLTALICTPLGGLACDRISKVRGRFAGARAVIMMGYGLSGVLLFVAAKSSGRLAAVTALCISVGGLYFAEPAFWATAVHLSRENAGTVSGLMNTAGILGGVISTSITPIIVHHFGWLPALGSGAAVAILCTVSWFLLGRRSELSVPQQSDDL